MGKFMLFFVGKKLSDDKSEETQAYIKKWMDWIGNLVKDGKFDSGLPIEWEGNEVKKDEVTKYNSPEIDIGGYMIINASSIDQATEIAKQAPNVEIGGSVIVRPCHEIQM